MREDDFSRLELDLKGCQQNYRYFRSLLEPSTKLLVLVKANAYGHGAVEFAAMMQRAGADYLAVAYPVEGMELRENGISLPIIVLTAGTDFYPEIVKGRMEPSIPNLESLDAFCTYLCHERLKDYPIHIKLDTGMHRLGFMTSEIPALLEYLNAHPEVKVKSLFSHLCVAEDPEEDSFTQAQFDLTCSSGTRRQSSTVSATGRCGISSTPPASSASRSASTTWCAWASASTASAPFRASSSLPSLP